MAEKHYFTFGQDHTHRVNGVTFDCDCVVMITGTYALAREKMFDTFGRKWSFQYSEKTFCPEYFPRGVIATFHVGS